MAKTPMVTIQGQATIRVDASIPIDVSGDPADVDQLLIVLRDAIVKVSANPMSQEIVILPRQQRIDFMTAAKKRSVSGSPKIIPAGDQR